MSNLYLRNSVSFDVTPRWLDYVRGQTGQDDAPSKLRLWTLACSFISSARGAYIEIFDIVCVVWKQLRYDRYLQCTMRWVELPSWKIKLIRAAGVRVLSIATYEHKCHPRNTNENNTNSICKDETNVLDSFVVRKCALISKWFRHTVDESCLLLAWRSYDLPFECFEKLIVCTWRVANCKLWVKLNW